MRFFICAVLCAVASWAEAHVPIYLQNRSSVPLVSPQGVVIPPQTTNIWNVVQSYEKHSEKIQPKPWRHVQGCLITWQSLQPGLKKPLITINQKNKKLHCLARYVVLSLYEPALKNKKHNHTKVSHRINEDDDLYILPSTQKTLTPQIFELMIYAIPERKTLSRSTEDTVVQLTKIIQ